MAKSAIFDTILIMIKPFKKTLQKYARVHSKPAIIDPKYRIIPIPICHTSPLSSGNSHSYGFIILNRFASSIGSSSAVEGLDYN